MFQSLSLPWAVRAHAPPLIEAGPDSPHRRTGMADNRSAAAVPAARSPVGETRGPSAYPVLGPRQCGRVLLNGFFSRGRCLSLDGMPEASAVPDIKPTATNGLLRRIFAIIAGPGEVMSTSLNTSAISPLFSRKMFKPLVPSVASSVRYPWARNIVRTIRRINDEGPAVRHCVAAVHCETIEMFSPIRRVSPSKSVGTCPPRSGSLPERHSSQLHRVTADCRRQNRR
jgi:hypothetical protein